MGIRRPFEINMSQHNQSLGDYLMSSDFEHTWPLAHAGPLSFHWADWRQTCLLKKAIIKSHPNLQNAFGKLVQKVDSLKERSVYWCHSGGKEIQQGKLYDLYASLYPTPQASQKIAIDNVWFDEDGPKTHYSSFKWIEWDDFRNVLYSLILDQTFGLREFRVRTYAHVGLSFDGINWSEGETYLRQISRAGFLFEFKSLRAREMVSAANQIFIRMGLQAFDTHVENKVNGKGHIKLTLERLAQDGQDFLLRNPIQTYSLTINERKAPAHHAGGLSNPLAGLSTIFFPWSALNPQRDINFVFDFLDQLENWMRAQLECEQ